MNKKKLKLWVGATYFAEGLPWSLLHQVAAEFFTAIGASPSKVGKTALLHIPIMLKLLWSPLVERYFTLRAWMVGTQALLGVLVGALAVAAHQIATSASPAAAESAWMWILLFSIGVLSATYDIACDGFYMENLSTKEQANFSGYRVAAYRVAMLLGSFLLVFIGGLVHWLAGFGLGAVLLFGLSVYCQFALPRGEERDSELLHKAAQHAAGSSRSWAEISDSYLSFVKQPQALVVIVFLLSYKAADAMMFSMSSVLLGRHLGVGTDLRASIGFFGMIASIVGAVWGGAWVARKGLRHSLFPITLLMVITEPLYALLAWNASALAIFQGDEAMSVATFQWGAAGMPIALVTVVTVIEKLCGGLAVAAQTIFIMQRCDPRHKTAHYAFATVVYSVAQIALGSSSGYIFEGVGPVGYYVVVCLLALPALLLAKVVPLEQR